MLGSATRPAKRRPEAMEDTTANSYLERFAAARGSLPGGGLPWLDSLRTRAVERFAADGYPSRKVESWRYTNLDALRGDRFAPAIDGDVNGDIDRRYFAGLTSGLEDAVRLVFVDGCYRADLSEIGALPAGVTLTSLGQALDTAPDILEAHLGTPGDEGRHAFWALNTAFMADGALLHLRDGGACERPIHLVHLATGRSEAAVIQPRHLIVAEAGSAARVLESYTGPDDAGYWTNAATQVIAGRGANLRHDKIQLEGRSAHHIAARRVVLATDADYAGVTLALGGLLGRDEIDVAIDGAGAACRLDGVYLGRGRQQFDTITRIDHALPGGASSETYKGVLDDDAHAVFQGLIIVAKDAQKTDAHMLNKTLLMSDSARIDTKPELEIRANDVLCSHGATAGDLDHDAMFYLRTRGIDEERARGLLVAAFVAETIDGVETAQVRDRMRALVDNWLAPQGGVKEVA